MTVACQHPTPRPHPVDEGSRDGRRRLACAGRLRLVAVLGAIAFGMVMPAPATAQQSVRFLSAGMLHERLLSDDPYAREAGKHYVLGVLDTLAMRRDPRVCLGPELEGNDLVIVVMRHLAARPDMHRYNAASFVREAIATEYPCV